MHKKKQRFIESTPMKTSLNSSHKPISLFGICYVSSFMFACKPSRKFEWNPFLFYLIKINIRSLTLNAQRNSFHNEQQQRKQKKSILPLKLFHSLFILIFFIPLKWFLFHFIIIHALYSFIVLRLCFKWG